MAPKKRASVKAERVDIGIMDDIESDGNEKPVPDDQSTTSLTRRGRRKRDTEGSTSVAREKQEEVQNEALSPAGSLLPPILDDGDEMEEIIVTRDEDDGTPDHLVATKEEDEHMTHGGVAAPPTTQKVAKAGAVGTQLLPVTPSRRVPRLKMDHELSDDVKKAQAAEDDKDRMQSKPIRKATSVIRRPTSPVRTRGFTAVATLSATMKESKDRLKRNKKEVKDESATSMVATTGGKEAENVETEAEEPESTNASADSTTTSTCVHCGQRFPLNQELIEHQLAHHKKEARLERERGGSLLCAHPHCGVTLKDMHHQLNHLSGYHNQTQFRVRQQQFASEEAFTAWKTDSEQRAKSSYIARNEELEIEPGVTELELYCECSEEWRNADKSKSLTPMLACPAHFTVHLDRKKDKVTIIGCTSHLGHLKKMNWSVYEPTDHSVAKKGTGLLAVKQSKCHLCGEWFRSRTALTVHRRSTHPDNIRTATIACGDPECDVVTDTMLSLCEHVVDQHKREDLTIEEYRFNSIQDFEVWKERMEADTMSYYTKVSGRQRAAPSGPNSDCFFRYYQCHLSGYNQRPSQKKTQEEPERVRIRNRGTKKMNRFCTAFMNIKINDADGSVLLKGCLGHFGHECDIRRVPMPNSLRNDIVDLLQKGVTEDDVLAIIKHKASQHDRAFYLQKYEVKNIVKKLIKESNGAIYYKYDDEDEDMGEEDDQAAWQVLKRPFSSTMYRSMIHHPKRLKLGTYALQFSSQLPRKRRLVYRQDGDHAMHEGEEYYESVVEEMATDMDEHVTYVDEPEIDPASSHHHVEADDHHEGEDVPHDEMHEEMVNEASTSSAHLMRRKGVTLVPQHQRLMQHAAARIPLLKDSTDNMPITERDRDLEFTIHNIRRKIMLMTERVKRCKIPEMSAQMLEEVRLLETRMARLIPQTGPGRLDQTLPQFARRHEAGEGEEEVEEEDVVYYNHDMVDEEGVYYDEVDDGRPGPSVVVPRRGYVHHEVIYQDVGSPGVEVDVEDLEMDDQVVIEQMNQ